MTKAIPQTASLQQREFTLGLYRTSDYGTAYDIAGKGIADHQV
jgi:4-hydroxy-L-threonine phosphate dehydrogenase PdxA